MWSGTLLSLLVWHTLPVFPGCSGPLPPGLPKHPSQDSLPWCPGCTPSPRHPQVGPVWACSSLGVLPPHSQVAPSAPLARLYQWHEGLRAQRLERGRLPSVCVWGRGVSMCIFHSSQGLIPSRMDGVFKANGPGFTPVEENSTAPTKAHGPQECGVAILPPRDEGPAPSLHLC